MDELSLLLLLHHHHLTTSCLSYLTRSSFSRLDGWSDLLPCKPCAQIGSFPTSLPRPNFAGLLPNGAVTGTKHVPNPSSSTPPPALPTTTKDERGTASSSSLAPTVSKDEPSLSSFAIRRNQFLALTKKNCIVLRSYWFINLLRCLIVPIAYYIFLGYAKNFFNTTNDLGLGQPAPIRRLSDGLTNPIYWLDSSTSTARSRFSSQQIMDIVLDGLQPSQRSLVRRVSDGTELGLACPQAFNGLSSCFGAVEFSDITEQGSVTYTLRLDPGLNRVRVSTNKGDAETRTLPLQFAIDAAILQLNGAPAASYSQPPLQ